MGTILVSACLLGRPVRYDGQSVSDLRAMLAGALPGVRLVAFCPEVAAGLPTPRAPAEITPGHTGADVLERTAPVATLDGQVVSAAFLAGAEAALELAQAQSCRFALLKDLSPSCATTMLHSGRFDGHKRPGTGVTAARLRQAGISVFSEHQIAALVLALKDAT